MPETKVIVKSITSCQEGLIGKTYFQITKMINNSKLFFADTGKRWNEEKKGQVPTVELSLKIVEPDPSNIKGSYLCFLFFICFMICFIFFFPPNILLIFSCSNCREFNPSYTISLCSFK